MRTPIKLLTLFLITAYGASVSAANGDFHHEQERTGVFQWLGKTAGCVVDVATAGIWGWATDPRYDGLTTAQRLAAVGCGATAAWMVTSEGWRCWGTRRKISGMTWFKAMLLSTVGILVAARPQPAHGHQS